jgi:lipopolysaccharide biosynthesis glycosyltransferase
MNIVGVTLGVGNDALQISKRACQEIENILNIETRIITSEYFNLSLGETFGDRLASLKFQIFNIFPDIERVMYFDSDWRPLQYFDFKKYCPLENKPYFVADRSEYWVVQSLEQQYGLVPGTYVNAGWFVISKKHHKYLLEQCKNDYFVGNKSHYREQDTFNCVFKDKIELADKRLNVLDLGVFPYNEILGLHNKEENYRYYGFIE